MATRHLSLKDLAALRERTNSFALAMYEIAIEDRSGKPCLGCATPSSTVATFRFTRDQCARIGIPHDGPRTCAFALCRACSDAWDADPRLAEAFEARIVEMARGMGWGKTKSS